jgi:phosphoribosyl 1,2-cyclic phosphodiesterase
MKFAVLGSGSGGNAYLVREGPTLVLLDAGFSYRQIKVRLALLGVSPEDLSAVVLTHEHIDHSRGLAVFFRRQSIPLYATSGTLEGCGDFPSADVHALKPGHGVRVGELRFQPFSVPHDAREPVGFIVENASGRRLGLASDLGTVTTLVAHRLQHCHLLALEANHDEEMLRTGPYPFPVKQRIRSSEGHLSNLQLCRVLPDLVHAGLHTLVPVHLSQTNNDPILVKYGVGEVLRKSAGPGVGCLLSRQDDILPYLEV